MGYKKSGPNIFLFFCLAAIILVLQIIQANAFWPFDLLKKTISGSATQGGYSSISPLIVRDVTYSSRDLGFSDGKTQYFSVGNINNMVYLISSDGKFTYDYTGQSYLGVLMVYFTFGANASKPFVINISYIDTSGNEKTIDVYFPDFDTSINNKKMYFYVASDGSTYYADAENDGIDDESKELLTTSQAFQDSHLAKSHETYLRGAYGDPYSRAGQYNNPYAQSQSGAASVSSGYGFISSSCFDSDSSLTLPEGKNYYLRGNISINGILNVKTDYCFNETRLIEYYCNFAKLGVEGHDCKNKCVDGACVDDVIQPPITKNKKDSLKYSPKEVFLVSDSDWKNVLSVVPMAVWTGNDSWCMRGYDTPKDVCAYPVLIYHAEGQNFDADSIIDFMQQYSPSRVTIIGQPPQALYNLLIAAPSFGAGLSNDKIRILAQNQVFAYWKDIKDIVYVENNYQAATMAAVYASLINAPLVIQGTYADNATLLSGKNITCVGDNMDDTLLINCSATYVIAKPNTEYITYVKLNAEYVRLTNTDKVIFVSSNDSEIKLLQDYTSLRSANKLHELYSKNSFAAPILASAKHELVVDGSYPNSNSYLAGVIQGKIFAFVPDIGNSPDRILSNDGSYWISGFLTIMGSPYAIPAKEAAPYYENQRALDPSLYADLERGDNLPDIAIGRIQGLTISDVSSYVARDLFYNQMGKTKSMGFLAGGFEDDFRIAEAWAGSFRNEGYNAMCSLDNTDSSGQLISSESFNCKFYNRSLESWSNDWVNKDFVAYRGHGSATWAGIYSTDIPVLKNSLFFVDACSTCANASKYSYCDYAIRKGAIGYLGAVDPTWTDDQTSKKVIEGIYKDNLTIGQAFAKSYEYGEFRYMDMLLGDPTFRINPEYKLRGLLPWY